MTWKHFSALLVICEENLLVTYGASNVKFDVSFYVTLNIGLNKQWIAHDVKHNDAHVMPLQCVKLKHCNDVIMTTVASQITSLMVVYWTVYSGTDQCKHQSSASLAFVWGIHRGPVNSVHKWPVTWKMFPFDDVIMLNFMANPQNIQINDLVYHKTSHINGPHWVD